MKINGQFIYGFGVGALFVALITIQFLLFPFLSTTQDKGSYAIGLQMGQGFARNLIEISPYKLAAGIRDGLSSKNRLSPAQQREGIDYIHKQAAERLKKSPTALIYKVGEENKFHQTPLGFRFKQTLNNGPMPLDTVNLNPNTVIEITYSFERSEKLKLKKKINDLPRPLAQAAHLVERMKSPVFFQFEDSSIYEFLQSPRQSGSPNSREPVVLIDSVKEIKK